MIKKNETFKFSFGDQYSTQTLRATQDIDMAELLKKFDILTYRTSLSEINLYEYVDGIENEEYGKFQKDHFKEVKFLLWLVQNNYVQKDVVRTFELFNPGNYNGIANLPFDARIDGLSIIDRESENKEYPIALTEPLTLFVVTDENNKEPLETDRAYPEEMEYFLEPIMEENQKIIKVQAVNVIYHKLEGQNSGYFTILNNRNPKKENKLNTPGL